MAVAAEELGAEEAEFDDDAPGPLSGAERRRYRAHRAAGYGRHKAYERATAPAAAGSAAAAAPRPRRRTAASRSSGPSLLGSAARAYRQIPASGPSQGSRVVTRAIYAVAAFVLALELGAQLSGRYFSWSLSNGAAKLQTSAQYLGFYPGQAAALAADRLGAAAPAAGASGGAPAAGAGHAAAALPGHLGGP